MTPIAFASLLFAATLRISEILADPLRVEDARGEFVEIENAGDDVFAGGFRIVFGGEDTVAVARDTIAARGFWILGRTLESDNGGFRPDLAVPGGWTLGNSSGEILLLDEGGRTLDRVGWSSSTQGASSERCPDGIWRTAAAVFGAGDRGSPGAPNSCDSLPREIEGQILALERSGDSLCARIRNRGTGGWARRSLEWRRGEMLARIDSLDLAGGASTRVCLALPVGRGARERWTARLPPDARPGDDTIGTWVREPEGAVVVAEIQAADGGPEWIELWQTLDQAFPVGGWSVGDGAPRGVVPPGAAIPAAGRLLLSSDCAALRAVVGVSTLPCAEPSPWPRLSVEADVLSLRDPDGGLWDSVSWNRAEWGAWPKGRTRERQELSPFGGASGWLPSAREGGTPGYGPEEAPGWSQDGGGDPARSFAIPSRRVRPGDPATPLRMRIVGPRDEELRVDLHDMGRRRVLRIHDGFPPRGGTLVWDGRDGSGHATKPGVYVVVVEFGSERKPSWRAKEWIVVSPSR